MQCAKSRLCEFHKFDVHRASFAKHLRSTMHEENSGKIPSNFFNEISQVKRKKFFIPKPSKDLARPKIKVDGKKLKKT